MLRKLAMVVMFLLSSYTVSSANELDLNPKGNGNGTGEGDFVVRVTYSNESTTYFDLYGPEIDEYSRYVAAMKFVKDLPHSRLVTRWCVVGTEDCF